MPEDYFGEGVKSGELTDLGRRQHMRRGLNRRSEYVDGKKFLSENFNPDEILSVSTYVDRCVESGKYFLHGLFPLQDIQFKKENYPHLESGSPLKGTAFETILADIDNRKERCELGPVHRIPMSSDFMIRHGKNCKKVDEFLSKS